jgi:surface antigen
MITSLKHTRILPLLLSAALLAACQTDAGNKEVGGTLLGATLGGLIGSQVGDGDGQLVAVAIGVLGGAFLGNQVGQTLDKTDILYAERNATNALETNQVGTASTWRNPDSGHSGTFTPTRTYQTALGENCRDYEQTVFIDGKTETATGRACRNTDGTWKIVQ